jgi:hypothetical protein
MMFPKAEGQILKGPGNSLGGNTVRFHLFGPFLAFKKDAALIGLIKPVDDIQHGGLSGAVGADDGQNLTGIDLKTDPIEGL